MTYVHAPQAAAPIANSANTVPTIHRPVRPRVCLAPRERGIVTVVARSGPGAIGMTCTSGTSSATGRAGGSCAISPWRSRRASAADSGRSSRSCSVIEETQPSRPAGTAGLRAEGGGTRSRRCFTAIAIGVSPVKGRRPVSIS